MTLDEDTIFRKRLFVDLNNNSLFNRAANNPGIAAARGAKPEFKKMNTMKLFVMVLLSLPALATLMTMLYTGSDSSSDDISNAFAVDTSTKSIRRIPLRKPTSKSTAPDSVVDEKVLRMKSEEQKEADFLPSGFDPNSCMSRVQSASYRKNSPFPASHFLISKLRAYEARHARCGPNTKSYNAAIQNLGPNKTGSDIRYGSGECNYVIWVAFSGLGNRILTIASAFLYALLTDRVLLVQHDSHNNMSDLFCEPFPGTTWLLPENFPASSNFEDFTHDSPECFGHLLKNNEFITGPERALVYVDIVHDYNDHDKMFFCDEDQGLVKTVQWVIIKSDNYFVPSLFLMETFRSEILRMFPAKETVFHHLSRYLFHPTNHVWGLVTRFYDAYLSGADERIGIQVRTFYNGPGPFPFVMEQIDKCIKQETLISEIENDINFVPKPMKTKAVLVTSLVNGYSEKLKSKYWLNPTRGREMVGIHQPSHEEVQLTDQSLMHNRKAWAEMYLLSLMDKLVTSAWSTFGYVAQGLGGLRPLILYKSDNLTVPDPACGPGMSIEPCFHAPPFYDCRLRRGADTGAMDEHVRHCEDVSWGLKIVDPK